MQPTREIPLLNLGGTPDTIDLLFSNNPDPLLNHPNLNALTDNEIKDLTKNLSEEAILGIITSLTSNSKLSYTQQTKTEAILFEILDSRTATTDTTTARSTPPQPLTKSSGGSFILFAFHKILSPLIPLRNYWTQLGLCHITTFSTVAAIAHSFFQTQGALTISLLVTHQIIALATSFFATIGLLSIESMIESKTTQLATFIPFLLTTNTLAYVLATSFHLLPYTITASAIIAAAGTALALYLTFDEGDWAQSFYNNPTRFILSPIQRVYHQIAWRIGLPRRETVA